MFCEKVEIIRSYFVKVKLNPRKDNKKHPRRTAPAGVCDYKN